MCCCGVQNCSFITRNSEVETPGGMPGAELSPVDVYTVHRLCRHFPHVSHMTSVLPPPQGLGDRPKNRRWWCMGNQQNPETQQIGRTNSAADFGGGGGGGTSR